MITIIAEEFRHWLLQMAALYLTIVAAGFTLIVFGAWFARTYWKFHLPRRVICPNTDCEETVNIDALPAAFNAIVGRRCIRVAHCSAWKGQRDCDEACIPKLISK